MNTLLAKISRITTTGFYVPELDGLRALAIFAVFLMHLVNFGRAYHFLPPFSNSLEFGVNRISIAGGIGVGLFFAISSFIISIPFQRTFLIKEKKVRFSDFYKRRLTRLEPPYLISLVFLLLARLLLGDEKPLDLVKSFFYSAFYLHNIIEGSASLINPVAWSLEIELQFYLLAPFIIFFYCKLNPFLRRTVLTVFTILLIAIRPDSWRWQHSVLGVFEFFAAGIIIADIYLVKWNRSLPRLSRFDFFSVLTMVFLISTALLSPGKTTSLLRAVSIFLFVFFVLGSRYLSSLFRNPWIAALGGMCYTYYLYHSSLLFVSTKVCKLIFGEPEYFQAYLILILFGGFLTVFVCTILFIIFERPFMYREWPSNFYIFIKRLFTKKLLSNEHA
jgi:peptidoglycan/LPS O-acetylase OafA/YrhL